MDMPELSYNTSPRAVGTIGQAKRIVTYSPAFTLVPTYECFNRCDYCNFRRDPGSDTWLSLREARQILDRLGALGVIEILILSGEVHPQSPRRAAWLERIYQLGELALEMGFLPHTNVGPLSFHEMSALREVNVSMGLMVEQVTPKLLTTVHRHAPSKRPALRLQQLEFAGQLRLPFTTGLLLGIGETPEDWAETLRAIARLHTQYGHIQEVILQPHQPGNSQAAQGASCHGETLLQAVQLARVLLPPDITLQIPPNLVLSDPALLDCLAAGATDLGGIGPIDEVNPDYGHRSPQRLANLLKDHGWQLSARLPIYERYLHWLPQRLRKAAQRHQVQFKANTQGNQEAL